MNIPPREKDNRDVTIESCINHGQVITCPRIFRLELRAYPSNARLYLPLIKQKVVSLDQAAPLAGWESGDN
ncbi:MAG: hypothetical protein H0W83_03155 [Planctomycetes bacterium]|nr:hypothetical protein [Planctomycetota bacterium]